MTRPVTIGVLGAAKIATEKVIPAMRATSSCEVVAIASRDAGRAERVAAELGIPRAHGSYEDLLADDGIEAVYNPLPNHLHAEWSIAAARAGKHVLCEKPIALTAAQAQETVDVCDREGVRLMEAFMYRMHSSWREVTRLVHGGAIGPLRAVHSRFSYFNDDQTNIRNIAEFGGGALLDIGCYCVSLSRLLFAEEPSLAGAALVRDPHSGTDILTSATLEFTSGHASFICSTRAEPDQGVQIWGERGRIEIEIPFNIPSDRPTRFHLYAGGAPPVHPDRTTTELPAENAYSRMADAFAAAVRDDRTPEISGADSVANMRVIDAIFAAQPSS